MNNFPPLDNPICYIQEGDEMMKKEKKNQQIIDAYDYLSRSAATTECTGLIPTPAESKDERDSYEAVYPYKPPKA